jgi:hypothetical protein
MQTTNVGNDIREKGTLIHCWWDCKLVQPLWKTVWRLLKKVKVDLPYDPEILLRIYLKECESGCNGNFEVVPLLTNGLRKCGIYTQWNFTQPQRRMKFCHLQVNGWNWRMSS